MQTLVEYIVEQISVKNPLHGKKLRKNSMKFDEEYLKRADIFLTKYQFLLQQQNKHIDYAIQCYLQMLADVNYESVQFIQTGEYSSKSFDEVNQRVYASPQVMEYYMHGLLLSQFLWLHHYKILLFFNTIIQKNSPTINHYLEVGGGHGLYISEAIDLIGAKAQYHLVDISQSSIDMAKAMVNNPSVSYILSDVYAYEPHAKYDFITMGEVMEHIEDPVKLLKKIYTLMTDDGKLFITTPTNAPAIDHIYLFQNADDIRAVIRAAGFEIRDELCFFSEDVSAEIAAKYKISMMYASVVIKQTK